MKLDSHGGMNIVFAIFVAIVISVSSIYIIKQNNLKSKVAAKISRKSSDRLLLKSFLLIKTGEFKEVVDKISALSALKSSYNCTSISDPLFENREPYKNRNITYTCQNAEVDGKRAVRGVILIAWIKRAKGRSKSVRIFIPDYFSIGNVVSNKVNSSNKRESTSTPKVAPKLTTLSKGRFIYESDRITSGSKSYVTIRLLDDTFVRLGGAVDSMLSIQKAIYRNNISGRDYRLSLDKGEVKFKSMHPSDPSKDTISISIDQSLDILPSGDKNGSEYYVSRIPQTPHSFVLIIIVLNGSVKVKVKGIIKKSINADQMVMVNATSYVTSGKDFKYTVGNPGQISALYKSLVGSLNTSWWDE